LPYLIEFENQPAAQGAAVQVTITNQLGPELDWQNLALTEIGFAGIKLPVPEGLSHFETRVPFAGWTWNASNGWHRGQTPLMVDVKAGLDIQTGLITLSLTCSDTNTGAFPEDAVAGFLPPNKPELAFYETNVTACCGSVDPNVLIQPGQGYMSYTVRPRTNLASGTVITNAASIVFDWNDPIVTPEVFNTIDAGIPSSSVLPLPGLSGRTFLVQWFGQDEPNGSGLANYDVYVSTDGAPAVRWLQGTSDTAAYFVGELGRTYGFHTVARDWVGHEEAPPIAPQAWTTVSMDSPVFAGTTHRFLYPNDRLVITNRVAGGLGSGFLYWVADDAPPGADVEPANGVFHWTPSCSQASRTNQITLWVADAANTNLLDAMTFTVEVGECVVPSLGRLVLLAGDSGRVPVHLISSVALTNFSMSVEAPLDRLTNLWLEPIVPEICSATLEPPAAEGDRYWLDLATCPSQWLIGTQQVAWLHFTTVPDQSSAFVTLALDNIVGQSADGTAVRNFASQAGRIVVVGEEPLLEAFLPEDGEPALYVYARPGETVVVETTTNIEAPVWEARAPVVMTSLFEVIKPVCIQPCTIYCRARRE
jgi:hypothetical protein